MVENSCSLAELMAAREIVPGTVIKGFTEVSQLDTFVKALRQGIVLRHQAKYSGLEIVAPSDNVFSGLFRKAKPGNSATGKVMDIRVTFLTPDTSFIDKNRKMIEEDTVITFLARAEIHFFSIADKPVFGLRGSAYVRFYNRPAQGLIPAVMMYTDHRLSKQKFKEFTNQEVLETPGEIWTWASDDLEGRVVVN